MEGFDSDTSDFKLTEYGNNLEKGYVHFGFSDRTAVQRGYKPSDPAFFNFPSGILVELKPFMSGHIASDTASLHFSTRESTNPFAEITYRPKKHNGDRYITPGDADQMSLATYTYQISLIGTLLKDEAGKIRDIDISTAANDIGKVTGNVDQIANLLKLKRYPT